jgi:uncharacterized protein YgiB involved in biofilm formation
MRRSPAKLVLASTLPLALAACGPSQDTPNFTAQANFKSVQECVEAKVPVDTCSDAFMQAMSDHRRIAPTYDDKTSCEADFVPDYCQVTSDGKYMPKLGGFELGFEGNVPKEALDKARAEVAQTGSGFSATEGLLTGLLIGNLLSNGFGGNRYYSQPIYQTRDDRGGYYTSSLPGQMNRGKTFSRSTQARTSPDNRYNQSTLGRNLGASGSKSSVSSTISRGGFGSQASARSGWGGKSSGGFSSGG